MVVTIFLDICPRSLLIFYLPRNKPIFETGLGKMQHPNRYVGTFIYGVDIQNFHILEI